jgi:survival of motor neuron-related-splicing factor 30
LQLDIVAGQLHDDPDNADLKNLTSELTDLITLLDENIAELQPKQQPSKPAPQEQPSSDDKWSRQNTSSYKKNADDAEEEREGPVKYNVNDNVMARWLSGDKAFYPARITSTTGSSTDPIYIVKFKTYDNTETLRSHDIRPMSNKRKAEGAPAAAVASAPAPSENPAPGVVKSAGATHYAEAKRENDAAADAPKLPKPKKIKANKELEKSKNNWQEFNSKSKFGKKSKKDSMFRTPEGVNGRGTTSFRNLFPPKAVMLTYL